MNPIGQAIKIRIRNQMIENSQPQPIPDREEKIATNKNASKRASDKRAWSKHGRPRP